MTVLQPRGNNDLRDPSSYDILDSYLNFLPQGVVRIACEYLDEEQWGRIELSARKKVANLFFKVVTCGASQSKELLNDALLNGQVAKAITLIQSGCSPTVSGKVFIAILEKNQMRSLNFILGQMRHNSSSKEFEDIKDNLFQLETPSVVQGLTIYLQYGSKLCRHDRIRLRKLVSKIKDAALQKLLKGLSFRSDCSCKKEEDKNNEDEVTQVSAHRNSISIYSKMNFFQRFHSRGFYYQKI